MSLLLEILVRNGLLMDIAGVTGLGLVALAAARLARRHKSWGGNMIAIGALAVLLARVYLVLAPRLIDNEALVWMGPLPDAGVGRNRLRIVGARALDQGSGLVRSLSAAKAPSSRTGRLCASHASGGSGSLIQLRQPPNPAS